ncbi:MAG: DNA/RNA nuclease SfsA [Spirochaetae bacterium HGW-Spirochaetae-5]|nr:MAG: DNA/RNA nuclease SfsA [Spirochaetae bacterium HGW-Spirochaetae-5]
MQKYPETLLKAILVKRINRFVAEVTVNNEKLNVYVPNTGRLSELALPGTEVLLSPINAKYKYKILYMINRSYPVMIDSTYSNRLFHSLLKEKKVPGLENYSSIRSEPIYGNHRFDFLITNETGTKFIELKSCTLFHNRTGAFPDAVSSRASEHVKELAESGIGELIFLVLKNDIEKFIPNYHTDFRFYETLTLYKDKINVRALTVQYDNDLKIQSLKEIPVIIPKIKPEGIFLLMMFNPEDTVNNDGDVLEQGFYIYCGDHEENVFKTINSIRKKNGIQSILPGKQFSKLKIISDLPIVTSSITTDEVDKKLIYNGGLSVSLDGQNNNIRKCIIFFKENPVNQSWFWDLILGLRFEEYK